jgi:acetoin utilization deacetylase AcuC-like enzyme
MVAPHQPGFSRSPLKPRLFVEHVQARGAGAILELDPHWAAFSKWDFRMAHTDEYVEAFFAGKEPLASSNNLRWSSGFADSVRYTNASLFHAISACVANPRQISFSPTSGFHHATPSRGQGFCTFSGQVIASLKLYRAAGLVGAYIDLDGHFGNSIEDSREFAADLNKAIPREFNINPEGRHEDYLNDLTEKLESLRTALLKKHVHYVVFCHGADSHEWDDLGGQVTTDEWLRASRCVYTMLRDVADRQGPVALALSLFGGYREDDYASVLDLHLADLHVALEVLAEREISFVPEVKPPRRRL